VSWGNGRDGIRFSDAVSSATAQISNCIIGNNGGYGINSSLTDWSAAIYPTADYNFFLSNTSGARHQFPAGAHDVALSGNPFNNSSSGDFSLNGTAGAGAAVRAAGWPGVMPGGLTTGYLDGGAAQHQDSGGAAGPVARVFSFLRPGD
jgi:hypothetical protein